MNHQGTLTKGRTPWDSPGSTQFLFFNGNAAVLTTLFPHFPCGPKHNLAEVLLLFRARKVNAEAAEIRKE